MKFTALFLSFGFGLASATTVSVNTSGFAFSPTAVTINSGDTVKMSAGSGHNAIEVSQSTYTSNGTTALSGGFTAADNTTNVKLTGLTTGVHYFVCTHHVASAMMKGTITVQAVSAVNPLSSSTSAFTFQIGEGQPIVLNMLGESARLSILDMSGRRVWSVKLDKSGNRAVQWDARLSGNRLAPAGNYIVRVTALDDAGKSYGIQSVTTIHLP